MFFAYIIHKVVFCVLFMHYLIVELFVTLVHVYIKHFSIKCELLYGLFDGLKGFLN